MVHLGAAIASNAASARPLPFGPPPQADTTEAPSCCQATAGDSGLYTDADHRQVKPARSLSAAGASV